MKFSVLMSVYSKEEPQYFDLALKSNLIDQTLKPDEFVLVCDGPLNEELDLVVEKYTKMFPDIFKVYRLAENAGLGNALNFGIKKCTNEIIARADSDDVCVPVRYEEQIEFLEKNQDIAVLGADIDEFIIEFNEAVNIKSMPKSNEDILKYMKHRNPINHMTVAFKKSVIEQNGSYMHMPYLEDYYLWVRVAASGFKFANLNEVLVHARVGNGRTKRRSNTQQISGWGKIGNYMLNHNMISRFEYVQNVIAIRLFVYMPAFFKDFSYKKFLRKMNSKKTVCNTKE